MLVVLLLAIVQVSQAENPSYGFALLVHRGQADTCEDSADREALKSIAVAIIEQRLYGDEYDGDGEDEEDWEDSEDEDDNSRRQLRGTAERELTMSCNNGGYCLCPGGAGCGSYWCIWCTGGKRRLEVEKNGRQKVMNYGQLKSTSKHLERDIKRSLAYYTGPYCWGQAVDVEVELYA